MICKFVTSVAITADVQFWYLDYIKLRTTLLDGWEHHLIFELIEYLLSLWSPRGNLFLVVDSFATYFFISISRLHQSEHQIQNLCGRTGLPTLRFCKNRTYFGMYNNIVLQYSSLPPFKSNLETIMSIISESPLSYWMT